MSHEIDRQALLESFTVEAGEHIALIEEVLLRIERGEQLDDDIHAIFRAAHTIKGAAACLSIETVTRFTHVLEDVVEQAAYGRVAADRTFVSLLFDAVDELRRLVAGGEVDPQWIERLRELPREQVPPSRQEPVVAVSSRASGRRTLRVEIDRLDAMLTAVGELGIASGHLGELIARGDGFEAMLEAKRSVDRLWDELQQRLIGIRMLPLATVFKPLTRVVRDVAATCGKEASLSFEGDDVELDLSVVEQLKDPLVHMIRNAVAHGLESPDERLARGKERRGSIALAARYDAGAVLVTLSDDGAGLDRDAIRERARQLGIPDGEPEQLIFQAGFSTASAVDDVSGRGIGMDVVRRNLESIRGSIQVASVRGEGTTFTMRVPLTLAVIDGFSVVAGGETFIVPIDAVIECLACPDLRFSDGKAILSIRGEPVPLLRLDSLVRGYGDDSVGRDRRQDVVVVRHGAMCAGFVVDGIEGSLQTLVRAIPTWFPRNPAVIGSAILGDGRIALILDIPTLLTNSAQPSPVATSGIKGALS